MPTNVELENKILRALELQEDIKRSQENLELLKYQIMEELKNSLVNEITVPLDELHDVKVRIAERVTNRINKEELANSLGVPTSEINISFLIKAVEDGRLSYRQFLEYIYQNHNENISIKKVKAKKNKVGGNNGSNT